MTQRYAIVLFLFLIPALMFGGIGFGKSVSRVTANADTSSPDAWGYTWVRSNEPGGPSFRWVDLTARPTAVSVSGLGDDNFVGPFPMLMSFPYYWYGVSSFWIGSNGYINFSSPANFAAPFAQLPNTLTPNDLLAICSGDLDFTITAANPRCLYWTNGADSLVVSFINVTEWQTAANPNLKHTFQVILNRADSSITYQYGVQQGRYNATNNTTLCIGMENATGQIGLNYTYSTTPPHALLPDSGIAIKWKRTVNTGLAITDVGTVGGFNQGNEGKIIRAGVADTIRAIVRNFGTANLTNVRVTYQISRALEVYRDTVFIPTMNAAQQTTVTFPRLFTPTAIGTYTALFSSFIAGDVGPGNNNRTAEIVVQPFAIGQSTRLQFEAGTVGGSINWTGGGGMGVAFDLPAAAYPVRVESVFVQISAVTTQPMTVQILDGSSGAPGAVLAERTNITAVVGLNTINFTSDSVRIRGGRFFIGGRGQMAWAYELTPPIANRTWEYTGGWAPYRSGDLQDVIIRATVRQEAPVNFAWTSQTSGTTVALRSVKAVNANIGWAAGASGVVLRTTNGGTAWSSVGGGAIGTNTVHTIAALNENIAIVGSSPADAFIYRTTNGGGTWTQVYTQVGGFINHVHMFDATNGIALGDPVAGRWTIVRTSDGGATWQRDTVNAPVQVGTDAGWINSFHVIGNTHFWFGTNASKIYRSTNGGLTWSSSPTAGLSSYAVWFNDTQTGVAAYTDGTVTRSSDGGATWTSVTLPGTGTCYGVAGIGGGEFWVTKGANVYKSADRGATWTSDYASTIGTSLRHVNFVRSGGYPSGWVISSTGGIARYAGTTVGVDDDYPASIPQEYSLAQNYPNPFNPSTNIRYGLPREARVSVKIYNLLGQLVISLRDEIESAGTHDVVWQGKNAAGQSVASAVYFYRLEATPLNGSTTFTSIKKMMFLK